MINCHGMERRFNDVREDYYASLQAISSNEKTVNGVFVQEIENKLRALSGRKHVLLVRSGTQALTMSLLAQGIRAGDEVIMTNYSCHASVSCITIIGAVPVFCEINEYGQMDPQYLESLVTEKTKAVVATGLYGDVHDHDPIEAFCKRYNLFYLNDAAQCAFATYKHQMSLSLGDIACMSFAENKPIPSLGTFGAILTDSDDAFHTLVPMRKNGKASRKEPFVGIGVNALPEEDKAAQILASVKHFDRWQRRRFEIVDYYDREFASAGIPVRPRSTYGVWNTHKYAIFPTDKFSMYDAMYAAGVDSECHYTENFNNDLLWLNKPHQETPWTDKYVKQSLTIPLHPYLTDAEVETIVKTVVTCFH